MSVAPFAARGVGGTVIFVALLAAGAMPAAGQEFGPPLDAPMAGDREIIAGLGIGLQPAYLGSDEVKVHALPLIAARWRNGWFAGIGGVGYRFTPLGARLSYGVKLSVDFGRDEDASAALTGLGDIDPRPEIGAVASYRLFGPVQLTTALRYGSGNAHEGLVADIGLLAAVPLSVRQRLFVGVGATIANRASMLSLFGVTETQSASSGYRVYSPHGGLRDITLTTGYGFALTPKINLMLGISAYRLLGDASDSPLTRQATGIGANLLLGYQF